MKENVFNPPLQSLTHHAYALFGHKESILASLAVFLKEREGISLQSNPNFWISETETIGVDDALALAEAESGKAFGGGKKVLILAGSLMTGQAQNKLLKVLEEPTPDTHIFLILPAVGMLLPTLRSRLEVLSFSSDSTGRSVAREFLKLEPAARIAFLKKFLDASAEAETQKKEMEDFFRSLEVLLYGEAKKNDFSTLSVGLSEFLKAKRYALGPSPSYKILLESLALSLPTVSE